MSRIDFSGWASFGGLNMLDALEIVEITRGCTYGPDCPICAERRARYAFAF